MSNPNVYEFLDAEQPSSPRSSHRKLEGKQLPDIHGSAASPAPKSPASTSMHHGGKELPESGIFDIPGGSSFHTSPSFERGRKSTKDGDIALGSTSSYVTAPGHASYADEPACSTTRRELEDRATTLGGIDNSRNAPDDHSGSAAPGLELSTSTSRHRSHHHHHHQYTDTSHAAPRQADEVVAPTAYRMLHGQHVHGREPENSEFWGPRVGGTQPGRRRGKKKHKRRVDEEGCCAIL